MQKNHIYTYTYLHSRFSAVIFSVCAAVVCVATDIHNHSHSPCHSFIHSPSHSPRQTDTRHTELRTILLCVFED